MHIEQSSVPFSYEFPAQYSHEASQANQLNAFFIEGGAQGLVKLDARFKVLVVYNLMGNIGCSNNKNTKQIERK